MKLCDKFQEYDRQNPDVWAMFTKYAFEALRAGRSRLSANLIFERIRWETLICGSGDRFKVNNNYRPYYARKFHTEYPAYDGAFAIRETIS